MSEPRAVSRRASLRRLSAAGAAIVLGSAGASSAGQGQDPKPPTGTQGKAAANVVDVAADRMANGHS